MGNLLFISFNFWYGRVDLTVKNVKHATRSLCCSSSMTKILNKTVNFVFLFVTCKTFLQSFCVTCQRLCVERILIGCLVPVTLEADEKMKKLLHIYCKLDPQAAR